VFGFCPLEVRLVRTRCGADFEVLCERAESSASSSSSWIAVKGSDPAPSSYSSDDDPGLSRLSFVVFDVPLPDDFDAVELSGYTQSRPPFLHPTEDQIKQEERDDALALLSQTG
jgi:hypothetical protein